MKWELRTVDNLEYEIVTEDDGSRYVEVSFGSTVTGPVIIRSEIDGIPVTRIRYMAFWGNRKLTEVTIPSSVTSIGERAFASCDGLVSVEIPPSVTDIEACAFWDCENLRNVTISSGVKRIGESAFAGCSRLTGVVIPRSVENIGDFAFTKSPKLKKLSIQAGNVKIGERAFYECESLESVAICGGVAEIGDWAFAKCENLNEVVFDEGVRSIGRESFWRCYGLTEVSLPSSVANIGCAAFAECRNLKAYNVVKDNSEYKSEDGLLLSKDGKVLFAVPCRLTRVTIPHGVECIFDSAFSGCDGLTDVTIPPSVKQIGEFAFGRCCRLVNMTIPDNVREIGEYAFCGCHCMKKLTLPDRFKARTDLHDADTLLHGKSEKHVRVTQEIALGDDLEFSVQMNFRIENRMKSVDSRENCSKQVNLCLDVTGKKIEWKIGQDINWCSFDICAGHLIKRSYNRLAAFADKFRTDEINLLIRFLDYILAYFKTDGHLLPDDQVHKIQDEIMQCRKALSI